MKELCVKGQSYQFSSNFRDNDALRNCFYGLTQIVYGFDFEDWYKNGYWGRQYIPYSLFDGDKMVSNVSVNLMDFWVFSKKQTFIQIGTVMTHPEYRSKGLNKALLNIVLQYWKER